jgi:pantoate--beta-alanine ligase
VNVLRTRAEVRSGSVALRAHGARLGLVPTMGALHRGHRALIRRAVAGNDAVLVSIFVNPLQFGAAEDLDRYPRTMEADLAMCREEGVAAVFAPDRATIYPGGTPGTAVAPGPLGAILEGQSRPGHFTGVLTVVAKLFHLVTPGTAYFGEKDYQQLTLIRAMVRDLDFHLDVVGCPTVREPDGLALSSRNAYLSAADRERALTLSRALFAGARSAADGEPAVLKRAREVLAAGPGGLPAVDTDYLELRDPDLGPAPQRGSARLLVAARVGTTRLIDNVPVTLGEE